MSNFFERKVGVFLEVSWRITQKLDRIAQKRGFNSRNAMIKSIIIDFVENYETRNGEVKINENASAAD